MNSDFKDFKHKSKTAIPNRQDGLSIGTRGDSTGIGRALLVSIDRAAIALEHLQIISLCTSDDPEYYRALATIGIEEIRRYEINDPDAKHSKA